MDIHLKKFSDLSPEEAFMILKLRQDVFIIEQDCIYPDIDGQDDKALHLLILKDQNLIAYLRIFPPSKKFEEASSIGRIVVHPDFRGGDIGPLLIKNGITYCQTEFPDIPVKIEAQAALEQYYHQFGFRTNSEVYSVDDIDHIEMILS